MLDLSACGCQFAVLLRLVVEEESAFFVHANLVVHLLDTEDVVDEVFGQPLGVAIVDHSLQCHFGIFDFDFYIGSIDIMMTSEQFVRFVFDSLIVALEAFRSAP